jgi:acyl carrier protein
LAKEVKARIVLIGRSAFPPKDDWQEWIEQKGEQDPVSVNIRRLMEAEQLGAAVDVKRADVSNKEEIKRVIEEIYEQYGCLNGVIHAAGAAGEKVFCLIQDQSNEESESQMRAKVYGAYLLEEVLKGKELDFRLLFSSNASILGGIGLTSYSAANVFMDALATSRSKSVGERWISVNWDGWLLEEDRLGKTFKTSMDQYAMTLDEGLEAFSRVASQIEHNQVVVSTGDLFERLDLWVKKVGLERSAAGEGDQTKEPHPRPALNTDFAPPTDDIQATIARIWQEQLGIDRLGIHDNFFELGGNSLIGLKIISLLKKELGADIPIVALFEGPTVSALAEVIARNGDRSPSYEESRNRGERRRAKRMRKDSQSQVPSSLDYKPSQRD